MRIPNHHNRTFVACSPTLPSLLFSLSLLPFPHSFFCRMTRYLPEGIPLEMHAGGVLTLLRRPAVSPYLSILLFPSPGSGTGHSERCDESSSTRVHPSLNRVSEMPAWFFAGALSCNQVSTVTQSLCSENRNVSRILTKLRNYIRNALFLRSFVRIPGDFSWSTNKACGKTTRPRS